MEIGISTSCFYPLETEKAFLYLAEKGIKTTEVFFNSPCELESGFVSELKKIKEKYKINIKTLHPFTSASEPYFLFGNYERRVSDVLKTYKRFFEVAEILGAEHLVIHGSRPQKHLTDELYCERFAKLVAMGKAHGVLPAQENVVNCLSSSPEFLKKLKAFIGDDFRAILDIKQTVRAKTDIYEYIHVLGDSIVRVHVSDNDAEYDCLPPGEGDFNFVKLFKKLDEIGFEWDLSDNFDERFVIAERYYAEHGFLPLEPKQCKNSDELHICQWLRRQLLKRNAGKLEQEKIDRLTAIGMDWQNSRERAWNRGYTKAKEYHEANGNLNVVVGYVCEDGYPLGEWLHSQRTHRKRLPEDRLKLLVNLGMVGIS